jgi:drug/metabolite transporter (DMT)-like permease
MSPLWLPLAIAAYAVFAVNGVVDKFLVSSKLKNPLIVSFWVGLFGIPSALILLVGLVPAPWAQAFRFVMPSPDALLLITAAGLTLQLSLMLGYMALFRGEATRVTPTIGAATPVFALIFAYLILGERMPTASYAAFALLFVGALLVSFKRGGRPNLAFVLAVASGAAAAFETVLIKLVYSYNHFISSFALLGLGNIVFCAILLVFVPPVRRELFNALHPKPAKGSKPVKRLVNSGGFLVFANNLLGSAGVVVLNLSLKLGSVSLVNALKGLQYVGIFLIALLLARPYPKLLKEELTAQTVRQKLFGIIVIGLGLGLLVVTTP